MMNQIITLGRVRIALVFAVLATVSSACDGILGSERAAFARDARVLVTNEGSTPLLLVTSTQFGVQTDPLTGNRTVTLVAADTTPFNAATYDETLDIFGADRFLAQVVNPDSTRTATVHMRVRLVDREVYNQRATLRNASITYTSAFQR